MVSRSRPANHERSQIYIGLMSGTSADGIDAVAVRIQEVDGQLSPAILAHVHRSFPRPVRARILAACLAGNVREICDLNFLLGHRFAEAAAAAMRAAGLQPRQVTAVGSHGQTIHHLPNEKIPSTLQIGEPAVIAELTGVTTVADFRVADVAAGGQGAPLVSYADWVLFTDERRPRVIQNLGGIGNLTFLPPRAKLSEVIAFDTGPGNMILDAVVSAMTRGRRDFDRDGGLAACGRVCEPLLAELMRHPYLRRSPPKTTGREEFGSLFVDRVLSATRRRRLTIQEAAATVTAFTAASVSDAYHRFLFPLMPAEAHKAVQVILGGGGAQNPVLKQMLTDRLSGCSLLTHEDFGIPNAAKEALSFAILAHETLRGRPSNVPSATGARHPVVLGKICR